MWPVRLLQLPFDALAEIIRLRETLEATVARLEDDLDLLKAEVVHIRRRVDEALDEPVETGVKAKLKQAVKGD